MAKSLSIDEYIKKQFQEHEWYQNSFKKAVSISNEFFHPKTNRVITWNEKCSLIETDLNKRIKNIKNRFENLNNTNQKGQ